jgi:hypothetical protein
VSAPREPQFHHQPIKPAPGKLSPAQVECHAALQRAGAQIATVDNIDPALAFLRRLGVLP